MAEDTNSSSPPEAGAEKSEGRPVDAPADRMGNQPQRVDGGAWYVTSQGRYFVPDRPALNGTPSPPGLLMSLLYAFAAFVLLQLPSLSAFVWRLPEHPGNPADMTLKQEPYGAEAAAYFLVGTLLAVGFIFRILRARNCNFLDYMALRSFNLNGLGWALLSYLSYFLLSAGISKLIGYEPDSTYVERMWETRGSVLLVFLGLSVAPAIVEELIFRGLLFEGFRKSIGVTWAIVVPSLLWAVVHIQYDILTMCFLMALGICLGLIRHKTGSLYWCIGVHALNNTLVFGWQWLKEIGSL
ncbi:MAG: type II CAAX endopeptidase family protein [Planctomycetota bacterium]